jgi:hypothetical protein
MIRGRGKTKKQREKAARDASRLKMTFDMPEELIISIKNLADSVEVSYSQLAAWLIAKGLTQVQNKQWSPISERILSRSPQYDYKMGLPEIPVIGQNDSIFQVDHRTIKIQVKEGLSENADVNAYANVRANARVNGKGVR